ncbi:HAD family hydrolase [Cohnella kolymensis]|uniref:HAD family hydrolase n=1 Tax=Cohnella kolymensis TaxID=1590652 RepID=A0ABR5A173_9BACL|nr:HAD hydrolase-like protein [Cohnella kolymensis]KIL34730.1 HAD family hydrolase [Cohnella kolymensis]
MKQRILFDLDDTLAHCNKYFNFILEQFTDEMTTWFGPAGISKETIIVKHTELDIAGVKQLGFKSEHFPQSFVDTYRYFQSMTGRAGSPLEEENLWKLGLSVYEQEVEPYPMMEEALEALRRKGHELHLYTGGDALIQRRKIEQLKLERYFHDRIYVRQLKNTPAMEQILSDGGFDRANTWMIGNSLRTDVLPALECGIHAVYLKHEQEWAYNLIPIDASPTGAFVTLTALSQVPSAIHNYLASAGLKEPV